MNPTKKNWPSLDWFLQGGRLIEAFKTQTQNTFRDYPPPRWSGWNDIDTETIIRATLNPEPMESDQGTARLFGMTWAKAPQFASALAFAIITKMNNASGRKAIVSRVWLLDRMAFFDPSTSDHELAANAALETGEDISGEDIKTQRKRLR